MMKSLKSRIALPLLLAALVPALQGCFPVVAGGVKQALVSAHLVDMGHGESCSTGAKRWSSGVRSLETPLNSVLASSIPSALVAAFFEQANGGFYDGDGRPADAPLSTITATGSNQRIALEVRGLGAIHFRYPCVANQHIFPVTYTSDYVTV